MTERFLRQFQYNSSSLFNFYWGEGTKSLPFDNHYLPMKILKRILFGIIALALLIAVAVYIYLNSTKPTYSGQLTLEGLQKPVEVLYDDFGVPHIYAQNDEDAYYALGYVHAQDRLFQMEMIRRAAGGRLSEILGPDLLKTDKLFRTLGN
jgi:penicillin amidase